MRDYDGVEIRLRKRLANRWSLDTSYLFSNLRGNWSGIASSDEAVGSLQPNSGRSFNLLYYSYRRQRQRELRPARDRSPASVQGAGDLQHALGNDGRRERARRVRRAALDRREREGHDILSHTAAAISDASPTFSQVDLFAAAGLPVEGHLAGVAGREHHEPVRSGHAQRLHRRRRTATISTSPDQQFFSDWDPEAVVSATPNFRRDARYRMASGYQDRRSIRLQAKFLF